jgi:hypothetical protein
VPLNDATIAGPVTGDRESVMKGMEQKKSDKKKPLKTPKEKKAEKAAKKAEKR